MKPLLPVAAHFLLLFALAAQAAAIPEKSGLVVTTPTSPPAGERLRIAQPYGRKGPTSIRFYGSGVTGKVSTSPNPSDPPPGRFYNRDRDLGQTFTVSAGTSGFLLDAVTLRLGPVSAANSITDARNATVFIQFFEVRGRPVIQDADRPRQLRPSPFAATTSDPVVTVGGLTRGTGITTLNTAAGSAWGGNGFDGTAVLADAITRGDFATFSITGNNGVGLTFDSIPAYNIRRSSTGPTTGQWQYQVGSSVFQNIGTAITWGGVTTSIGNPQSAVSLSGLPGLQDVPPGVSVTFRLVAYGASGATGNFYINNAAGDDLAVMGTASAVSTTPVITSPYTATATAFEAFSYQITATNTPTSFATTGLPNGLSLNPATGLITGTPLATGVYQTILTASNLDGDGTATLAISVTPNPGAPAIGGSLVSTGRLRAAFEYQVQTSNSPTAWLASDLPPGLEINNTTGLISGTPTLAGTFAVPVTVQNAVGSDTKSLTLTVLDPTLNLTPEVLAEFAADLGSASASQTYTVSGSSLTGPVTVLAPEGFEISNSGGTFVPSIVLNPVNEALTSVAISVRLAGSTPLGIYAGSLIHSGGGAIPKYLATSGTVSALVPTLALSVGSLDGFSAGVGSTSIIQSYKLTGSGLTGPITLNAPVDFEISQDGSAFTTGLLLSPANGGLSTYIYVRLAATAPAGTPTGSVNHTGGGASPVSLALSGTVSIPSGPVITSTTSGSVYVNGAFGHPITVEGTPTMVHNARLGKLAELMRSSSIVP
jgi:hypothetical protein